MKWTFQTIFHIGNVRKYRFSHWKMIPENKMKRLQYYMCFKQSLKIHHRLI